MTAESFVIRPTALQEFVRRILAITNLDQLIGIEHESGSARQDAS